MGDGNETSRRSVCVGRILSAGSRAKLNSALARDITDAHKSSSEVYGKIEGFSSPAV